VSAGIRAQLGQVLDAGLVQELLQSHEEARRNFYLGGLRLSAVEGGRFCEAAYRILEQLGFGKFTPVGTQLDTDGIARRLSNIPAGSNSESVRLHIPRGLRVVYDIRNKRDAAHLADGIDPNMQDATLVVAVIDWVLAEFLRLMHNVPANEAQATIERIVARRAPVIQDFNGHLKVLKDLPASDYCLVLLYHRGNNGATFVKLKEWARPKMRKNLRRNLGALVNKKDLVHQKGSTYYITHLGEQDVETRKLAER